jgi:hypothetical protein
MENEGSGEVCLLETVERLWRSGLGVGEISERTGLDAGWIDSVVAPLREGGEELTGC